MRIKNCIFCGRNSEDSRSIEHIIPESLGNKELILERGIVCDKCNNYFARKIEEPVLSLDCFKQLRFYNFIENKRGHIPLSDALFCGEVAEAQWVKTDGQYSLFIGLSPETIEKMINNPPKMFFTRGYDLSDHENHRYEISRFLSKVAIEYFVYQTLTTQELEDEELNIIFDEQLKKLINYVRVGRENKLPINYEVTTNKLDDGFLNSDYKLSIGFTVEKDDLIFNFEIMNTIFKLNLSQCI